MENLKEVLEVTNLEELKEMNKSADEIVESINQLANSLEEDIKETSKEIKQLTDQLEEKEVVLDYSDSVGKSVEELFDIEVLEGNKRRMTVEGETYEYETTETVFEKFDENASEEEVKEGFKKYNITEEHYAGLDHEERIVLLNYFAEQEALHQEMNELQEKFNSEIEEFNRRYEEQLLDGDKETAIKILKEKKELYLKYNKKQAAVQIQKIIDELEGSITLDIMKKQTAKIKNHKKIIDNYETGLQAAHKKFYTKLRKNRNSKFIYRENLHEDLIKNFGLTEFNAKLFTYLFYGFAHNEKIITQNSILINEIIKNISTGAISEKEKERFRQSILEVIAIVCE